MFEFSDLVLAAVVAGATVIGAGIGGAITGIVTLRAEDKRQRYAERLRKRQERRERRDEKQRRQRELKEAARLVDEELREATELIRDAVFQGRFWDPSRTLPAEVYRTYRNVLAVSLNDDSWTDVSLAFQEIGRVNWERHRVGSISGDTALKPLEREDLLSVGIDVVRARKALAPHSSPPDKENLLSQDATETAVALFPLPEEGAED